MKEIVSIAVLLLAVYLLLAALMYVFQRRLIYYPTPFDKNFNAAEVSIDNRGTRLHGWVLNPGKTRAVIYFGGNSEPITQRSGYFEDVFRDYSVYLINYRGYGNSAGSPSEAGLFSDALAIYDWVSTRHASITAYGRSLGSGVAVYLAAHRPLEKLILLTPFDSVAEIAQKVYPLFPVAYLIKDRFDSAARAGDIQIPVLIISAEFDRVVKLAHTLALKQRFAGAALDYRMIAGAAHDNITDFPEYRDTIKRFLAKRRGALRLAPAASEP